jgi:hypothetical protein
MSCKISVLGKRYLRYFEIPGASIKLFPGISETHLLLLMNSDFYCKHGKIWYKFHEMQFIIKLSIISTMQFQCRTIIQTNHNQSIRIYLFNIFIKINLSDRFLFAIWDLGQWNITWEILFVPAISANFQD